jgi:predicted DCC family thiol-disulfide oxidoreductase YuxK
MNGPVLLYDGVCGFCNASVQLVLRHDRRRTLRFAPLQGSYAEQVLAHHLDLRGVDSVVWVEPGADAAPPRVFTRSSAALRVARYLGGPWSLLLPFWLVPRPLRDWVYDIVARNRHRLVGSAKQCLVPPPAERHRFLEVEANPVLRKLAAIWEQPAEREQVLSELQRYGRQTYEREADRVRLAILKLCEGRRDRVTELVAAAKRDYRDVLMWAEYPAEGQALWSARADLSEQERRRLETLRQQDRRQYEEWLEK